MERVPKTKGWGLCLRLAPVIYLMQIVNWNLPNSDTQFSIHHEIAVSNSSLEREKKMHGWSLYFHVWHACMDSQIITATSVSKMFTTMITFSLYGSLYHLETFLRKATKMLLVDVSCPSYNIDPISVWNILANNAW